MSFYILFRMGSHFHSFAPQDLPATWLQVSRPWWKILTFNIWSKVPFAFSLNRRPSPAKALPCIWAWDRLIATRAICLRHPQPGSLDIPCSIFFHGGVSGVGRKTSDAVRCFVIFRGVGVFHGHWCSGVLETGGFQPVFTDAQPIFRPFFHQRRVSSTTYPVKCGPDTRNVSGEWEKVKSVTCVCSWFS